MLTHALVPLARPCEVRDTDADRNENIDEPQSAAVIFDCSPSDSSNIATVIDSSLFSISFV